MLKSKSFIVIGETIHRDNAAFKTIAENVDRAINGFLESVGGKYVDLKIDSKVNPGVGTDTAFITVIVEVEEPKSEDAIVSKKKK